MSRIPPPQWEDSEAFLPDEAHHDTRNRPGDGEPGGGRS
jgi:hypothetical protein